MRAKCIQECFDGPRAWKYTPDGGEKKDGFYDDINPDDPIAKYFEFPDAKVNEKVTQGAEAQAAEREKKAAEARKAKKDK